MKKVFALLALTSFVSLTLLAGEPTKASCDKKEGKACCNKEASAEKGKSCCSKDAAAKTGCSKDAKSSCSHDKAGSQPAEKEMKSDK